MLTEDQLEGAVILYFTAIMLLCVSGALVFALSKRRAIKAIGVLVSLFGFVGAIKFMEVLDWMYPVLKYLP